MKEGGLVNLIICTILIVIIAFVWVWLNNRIDQTEQVIKRYRTVQADQYCELMEKVGNLERKISSPDRID
jgi:predicted PurR-regulated permease PerM